MFRRLLIGAIAGWLSLLLPSGATAQSCDPAQIEANKRLARLFYRDLWFTDNRDNYRAYVADNYVVHDTRGVRGVTEPAVAQKEIADFFWDNADLTGEIQFQIADCNRVATRWTLDPEPTTLFGRIFIGTREIPIINVFRIEQGKIVEFWNHRHDIDTPQTLPFVFRGLGIGLLIALVPTLYALRLRRRLKRKQG